MAAIVYYLSSKFYKFNDNRTIGTECRPRLHDVFHLILFVPRTTVKYVQVRTTYFAAIFEKKKSFVM